MDVDPPLDRNLEQLPSASRPGLAIHAMISRAVHARGTQAKALR